MAEHFENLDNSLHDWAKDKVKTGMRSRKKKEKAISFLGNDLEKILKQSQLAVERD